MGGSNRPHVVLVHGNFLGPWCWQDVIHALTMAGVQATAVRLPSSGQDNGAPVGDLHDDAEHVRATLDAVDGPVVLCGHSYGGAVITEAAAGPLHPAVVRLVYLSGAIPDVGESLGSLTPAAPADSDAGQETVRFRTDGMIELTPESARASLFHDCTPQRAEDAIAQLQPSNPAVGSQHLRAAAWHSIPTTYVRGSADRMPELLSPALPQDSIDLDELPTGHCPQWSEPRLVTDLLITD